MCALMKIPKSRYRNILNTQKVPLCSFAGQSLSTSSSKQPLPFFCYRLVLLFLEFHLNETIHTLLCLAPFAQHNALRIHPLMLVSVHFFLLLNSIN